MSSKHRYRSRSNDDDSSLYSYSSSSSDSDYHSKHKRKKRKSKHKHKHKKRRKKHKKDKKSKHKKRSKSKHKHSKHHSKKRHHNHSDNDSDHSNTHNNQPKHKKRKLNTNNESINSNNPCTKEDMIINAKKLLNMFCGNDESIKQYMINIFNKLDNNQSICISKQNLKYQQPLKMIFTFLSLNTNDGFNYTKNDNYSLISLFNSALNTHIQTIETDIDQNTENTENTFIGPAMPPTNYKRTEIIIKPTIPTVETLDNNASDMFGVTMPTNDDLLNNKYSSSDDDAYGPTVMDGNNNDNKRKLQMAQTKIYNEMHKKIKGEIMKDNENNDKREEWMKIMPEFEGKNKGIKTGFNMNENVNKMDKTWMETPNDKIKQMNERERIRKIQMETNEKLMKIGLPTVEKYRKERINEYVNNKIDMIEEMEKKSEMNIIRKEKSLFEMHQEKLMNEYKNELKEWKKNKKKGKKVGAKPVFKGAKKYDINGSYGRSREEYCNPNNPVFKSGKLSKFVNGGSIDDY